MMSSHSPTTTTMAAQQATPSPLASTAGQPLKYTVEHFRKDGVSEQAFHDWFHRVHLPQALPLLKKHGILRYAVVSPATSVPAASGVANGCQHVRDAQVGAAFQAVVDQVRPGWKVSECDLVLEYWMESLESVKALAMDPEWNEKAVKGQGDWLDMSRAGIHIGYDTTYLDRGEIVDGALK